MPLNRMSVRQLLHLYGYEKRGKHIEVEIQRDLNDLGLYTEPDFRHVPPNALDDFVELQRIKTHGKVLAIDELPDGNWRLIVLEQGAETASATRELDRKPDLEPGDDVFRVAGRGHSVGDVTWRRVE